MPNYLTEEGSRKLKSELQTLKEVKRPAVIRRIAAARELGDLSENGDYHDAKDEQGFIEGRISELENIINKSEVIIKNNSSDEVSLGSNFLAECDGKEREFTIVGVNEASPAQGLISYQSPLGTAFMGRRVGDEVEVDVPKGKMMCKVLKIHG